MERNNLPETVYCDSTLPKGSCAVLLQKKKKVKQLNSSHPNEQTTPFCYLCVLRQWRIKIPEDAK